MLVYFTPYFKQDSGKFNNAVYVVWIIGYVLHQVCFSDHLFSDGSFFAPDC